MKFIDTWKTRPVSTAIKLMVSIGCLVATVIILWSSGEAQKIGEIFHQSQGELSTTSSPPVEWVQRQEAGPLPELPVVALTGIDATWNSYESQQSLNGTADLLQSLLGDNAAFRWVERRDLKRVIDEQSLTRQFATESDVIQAGRWVGADLVMHAWISREKKRVWADVRVIDVLTGETAAARHVELGAAVGKGGVGDVSQLETLVREANSALAEGKKVAKRRRNQTRVAALFVSNISPTSRLSEIEPALFRELDSAIGSVDRLHLMRFDQTKRAGQEKSLSLMGLTDSDAWQSVAHYYLWGSVRATAAGKGAEASDFEVSLTLWDGGRAEEMIVVPGQMQDMQHVVDDAVQQLMAKLKNPIDKDVNPALSERLSQRIVYQSRVLQRNLIERSKADTIPQTDWGRSVFEARHRLLELACFLAPTAPNGWSELLAVKQSFIQAEHEDQFGRYVDYLQTRRLALNSAGANALRSERAETVAEFLNLFSGTTDVKGIPRDAPASIKHEYLEQFVEELANAPAGRVDDRLRVITMLSNQRAKHLASVDLRADAVASLWPSVKEQWAKNTRRRNGKNRRNTSENGYNELDAGIADLMEKAGRGDEVQAMLWLDALPQREPTSESAVVLGQPRISGLPPSAQLRVSPAEGGELVNRTDPKTLFSRVAAASPDVDHALPQARSAGIKVIGQTQLPEPLHFKLPKVSEDRRTMIPRMIDFDNALIWGGVPINNSWYRASRTGARVENAAKQKPIQGFHPQTGRVFSLIDDEIPVTEANDLAADSSGLWIATSTEGVWRYRFDDGALQFYGTEDGLLDRRVSQVFANDHGTLLIYEGVNSINYKLSAQTTWQEYTPVASPPSPQWIKRLEVMRKMSVEERHAYLAEQRRNVVPTPKNQPDRPGDGKWALCGTMALHLAGHSVSCVDLTTGQSIDLVSKLADHFSDDRESRTIDYCTADERGFWLINAQHLVHVKAGTYAISSWRMPNLAWRQVVSDGRVLWMQSGMLRDQNPDSWASVIAGFDPDSGQWSSSFARANERLDLKVSGSRLWLLTSGVAEGYDLAELSMALGSPKPALPPKNWPEGLADRLPESLARGTFDPGDAQQVEQAFKNGELTRDKKEALQWVVDHCLTHDIPEPILLLDGHYNGRLSGAAYPRNTPSVLQRAGAVEAFGVLEAMAAAQDDGQTQSVWDQAFHGAVMAGNMSSVRRMVAQGLIHPEKTSSGADPLVQQHYWQRPKAQPVGSAALRGNKEMVEFLLREGAFVTARSKDSTVAQGMMPLTLAVLGGHDEVLPLLLDAGADPYEKRNQPYDYSPLQVALLMEQDKAFDLLFAVDRAKSIQHLGDPKFMLVLSYIGCGGPLAKLQSSGVDIGGRHDTVLENYNKTVKLDSESVAIGLGSPEAFQNIQLAIDAGMDLNRIENGARLGDVALIRAAFVNPQVVASLLDAGYGPDVADRFGTTPLMAATHADYAEVVAELLSRGADPHRRNRQGHSAVSLAESARDRTRLAMQAVLEKDNGAGRANRRTVKEGAAGPSPWLASQMLREMLKKEDLFAAEELLSYAMVDFDDSGRSGDTVLEIAINNDQLEFVQLLAEKCWALSDSRYAGRCFTKATATGHIEVASVILENTPWDLSQRNEQVRLAIDAAIDNGDPLRAQAIEKLLADSP